MARNENDLTRNPTRFVIIAGVRSGGTLLAHSLDSHPLISCMRGEPYHSASEWKVLHSQRRINLITNLTGYLVSGFKLQNDQLTYPTTVLYIKELGLKIIKLTRENILNQAISLVINNQSRKVEETALKIPQHSFEEVDYEPFKLSPKAIINACVTLEASNLRTQEILDYHKLSSYDITYEQMTLNSVMIQSLPYELTGNLCKYLGVGRYELRNFLHRINWKPYSESIINWEDIITKVKATKYGEYLCQPT